MAGRSTHHETFNDTLDHAIVPDERIIWSYTMQLGATPISVSRSTLALHRGALQP